MAAGGAGALVGRLKIAENTSPIPQNRWFVNYSSFDNVPLSPRGVSVNRFTVGFEKTFFHDLLSYSIRVPMASTLENSIFLGGPDRIGSQLGNVSSVLKALLYDDGRIAFSAGMALSAPTAEDLRVLDDAGREIVRVRNRAVHLMPFLGYLHRPTERLFSQGFIQVDVDLNGDPVLIDTDGQGLQGSGRLNDPTFLYLDWAIGYWLYQSCQPNALIRRVAPILETHYNTTLADNDVVQRGNFRVGDFGERVQRFNLLTGLTIQGARNMDLSAGYVVPMGNGADQQFDGELRVVLNQRF